MSKAGREDSPYATALAEAGLSRQDAARWQKLAAFDASVPVISDVGGGGSAFAEGCGRRVAPFVDSSAVGSANAEASTFVPVSRRTVASFTPSTPAIFVFAAVG